MKAPDLSTGYPSRGKRIGPAWVDAWNELLNRPADDWCDGIQIWTRIAPEHSLSPDTLRALFYRMAAEGGPLERETHVVVTDKGRRSHAHFRIKHDWRANLQVPVRG